MSIFRNHFATSALLAAFIAGCQSPTAAVHPAGAAPATPIALVAPATPAAAPAASGLLCPGATALEAKTKSVAEHCVACTVGILTTQGVGMSSGSGVLVSADGLVLTAGHVVDAPGTQLTFRMPDGRVAKGVALGVDRGVDTGMARITDPAPAGGWPFVEMAPANSAEPGEWVLATGNPGGLVVGRNPPLRLGRITIHDKARIQSDCTVVSGDSGGPLFDLAGRVVGIHSNISLSVDENRHVPISLYHTQWKDLLESKSIQAGGGMLDRGQGRQGRQGRARGGAAAGGDLSRIGEALRKLAKEGDAEAQKLIEESKASDGKMKLDPAKAKELIARAKLPAKPGVKPDVKEEPKDGAKDAAPSADKTDLSRVGEALEKLVKEGDAEAKKLMEDAKANGGKMNLSPEQAAELVARAKLPSKDGAPAGAGVTPARVREALKKLASEGDAEAKKLLEDAAANGDKLGVSADKAAELVARAQLPAKEAAKEGAKDAAPSAGKDSGKKAASGIPSAMRPALRDQIKNSLMQQFPGAKITDALLERIMDKSSFDAATGHLQLSPDLEDLAAMGLSPAAASPQTARVSQRLGETSLQALSLFAPALDAAGDCMVEVCSGGKPILMGTVVDADGWVVTKASDLSGSLTVVLANGRTLAANVAGKDEATDLALLKVDAKGLEAAPFADGASPLGAWMVSPVRDPNRPAVGLVSVAARPIPALLAHFQGEQKVMLGLSPKEPGQMVVGTVVPGLPAAGAGMKSGDEIMALDGQPATDWLKFVAKVKEGKPGQVLAIKIRREGKEMEFKMTLGDGKMSANTHDSIGEADKYAGGKLSKRRTNFPSAIQHDTVVWADQCGGPLVDLRGKVVGVNIARYDRVCTFALPADLVQKTVAKLRAAAK